MYKLHILHYRDNRVASYFDDGDYDGVGAGIIRSSNRFHSHEPGVK